MTFLSLILIYNFSSHFYYVVDVPDFVFLPKPNTIYAVLLSFSPSLIKKYQDSNNFRYNSRNFVGQNFDPRRGTHAECNFACNGLGHFIRVHLREQPCFGRLQRWVELLGLCDNYSSSAGKTVRHFIIRKTKRITSCGRMVCWKLVELSTVRASVSAVSLRYKIYFDLIFGKFCWFFYGSN